MAGDVQIHARLFIWPAEEAGVLVQQAFGAVDVQDGSCAWDGGNVQASRYFATCAAQPWMPSLSNRSAASCRTAALPDLRPDQALDHGPG